MRQPPEAAKFFQRLRVVIHAKVETRKRCLGPDTNRAGLAAPLVASRLFARLHRNDETLVKVEGGCVEIGFQSRVNDLPSCQHVAGDGHVGTCDAATPVDACRTGISRRASFPIDQMHLPMVTPVIGSRECRNDLLRRATLVQHLQPVDAKERVCEGLGRQNTGSARSVGNDRPDRQRSRRTQDTKRARLLILRDNRPGHAPSPPCHGAAIGVRLGFRKAPAVPQRMKPVAPVPRASYGLNTSTR